MPKPLDLCVIVPAFAAVALSFLTAYSGGGSPAAGVMADGGRWILPLDADVRMSFAGPIGDTEVTVFGGEVRVASSPCRDQVCVAMGGIRSAGRWLACLPNRVMVYVAGGGAEGNDVDAAAW